MWFSLFYFGLGFKKCIVPLGIAAFLQASIYDVPGGYRAVMFDRFSGVKDRVELLGVSVRELRSNKKC